MHEPIRRRTHSSKRRCRRLGEPAPKFIFGRQTTESKSSFHLLADCKEISERHMRKTAIRLLTLAIYATALAAAPMVTPARAETSSSTKTKKHKKLSSPGFSNPWSAGQPPRPSGQAGAVCPGIARSFECKTWPPPMDDDPDRKHSSSD